MGVAFQNGPADGGGLHGGEQGAERSEDFGRGAALVADEAADPDVAVFHDDASVKLQVLQKLPHVVLIQPGFKGDFADGHGQHAEVVGVRAGEQVEVQELLFRRHVFNGGVVPERHADGAVGRHYSTSTVKEVP